MRPNTDQETTFGYLSALETEENGYLGGYLVISALGRPLEFHCTAPIRPSRAQEILYGPTLKPYLLAEQIGRTLLDKSDLTPKVILTDQPAILCLRSQIPVPIVCLRNEACDEPPRGEFTQVGRPWELPSGYEGDWAAVAELLDLLSRGVDVGEPFGRIHEAIREALRIGAPGTQAHDQAA